uniref:Secreted protein n=1 Tax=Cacopsylla melanoneura TaxID=428564 RepID=A0A8D8TA37_9HEMI
MNKTMTCFLPLQHLSLCLILCFVTTVQAQIKYVTVTSDIGTRTDTRGGHFELGCKFLNEQYETRRTQSPIWTNKPSGSISVSSKYNQRPSKNNNVNSKTTNEPAVLNISEWYQFKHELRQSFIKTLKTNTLNDVYPFIR